MAYYKSTRPEMLPVDTSKMDPLLVHLLQRCTPHGYESFIADIVKAFLAPANWAQIEEIEGNLLIKVGQDITSMFSCHMDMIGSVTKGNADKGLPDPLHLMTPDLSKLPKKERHQGMIYGAKKMVDLKDKTIFEYQPCTIGADDKLGVYILLKMIEKQKPGLYVFHVGEERGGIGSKLLSEKYKDKFKGISRAIAFDRANYGDVIEHQRNSRCCSSTFGKALAKLLNEEMPQYQQFKDGIHGSFTDTAFYTNLIPECTNISVGYFNQHGDEEHFDYVWLKHILLPAILNVDFDTLPTERDPSVKSNVTYYSNTKGNYVNSNRKTWETATKDTLDWDLPLWEPKDGFIDAEDGVLERSVARYISQCTLLDEKRNLALFICDNLEMLEYYNLELQLQKGQIKRLTNLVNRGNVEDLSITKKKFLLTKLTEAATQFNFPNNDNIIKAIYKATVKKLGKFKQQALIEDFTKEDLKSFNRSIFNLAYFMSISGLQDKPEIKWILDEVEEFINLHQEEEGFEMPEKKKKHLEKFKIKDAPIDTGVSTAVH